MDERAGFGNDDDRAAIDVPGRQSAHHVCNGSDADRCDECNERGATVCGQAGPFQCNSGDVCDGGWRIALLPAASCRHVAAPSGDPDRNRYTSNSTDRSSESIYATGATVLLALLAGLSSGMLARFQLVAICGVGSLQPMWQIALSLGAVCALSFIADRSGNKNWMLIALYVSRAALIAALAAADAPTAAVLAARIFVILDCLTIPALMKPRGKSSGVINAGCPGAAHHVGMILGATLSTTPYFFGHGFTMLYVSAATANLACAVTLATGRWPPRKHLKHRTLGQTYPASTKCESGSMTALSLRRNVREHRFQMHHYRSCAGDPLKN